MRKYSSTHWWILVTVQLSNLVSSIDATIVNVSLPSISEETHADLMLAQWVITSYLLTVMMGLLIAGRMADVLGRKRVFVGGFIIFTAGSLMCGAAPDCRWLIGARIIQALGAASLLANANAILTVTFEGAARGFALGLNSTIVAGGYSLGYVLGGLLTQYFGWRSVFYVNAPLGIAAVWLCATLLPPDRPSEREESLPGADWRGAALSCLSLGCLLFGAERLGGSAGWGGKDLFILCAGLALFVLFIHSQLRAENPLLHVQLFKLRAVSVGLGCLFCFTATLAATTFVFPFYLKGILGLSPSRTGLALAPYSIALCTLGPFTGWLTTRMRPGWMSAAGFLAGAVACTTYSRLGGDSSFLWISMGQFGLGLAGAAFLAPNRVVVLSSVPQQNLGEASALLQCVRFFGLSVGTMMASLLFESLLGPFGGVRRLIGVRGPSLPARHAFLSGVHLLFPVTAVLLVLGAVACAWNTLYPVARHVERGAAPAPRGSTD